MRRPLLALLLAALALSAACGAERTSNEPLATPSPTEFPACDEVSNLAAAPGAYRPEPIYVGNEMPTDDVLAWAQGKPNFQGIWVDREHQGWITVAFAADVTAIQQELIDEFPGVGVVAVEVENTMAELNDLQARVNRVLSQSETSYGSGTYENRGVVSVTVNRLTPELKAALEAEFAGEPLCIEAPDPASLPEPGPQPDGGDGWRLLADEAPKGEPYQTGIATDAASLEELWARIGLDDSIPDVDFENEVVIWFGAVYGGSCPNLRLDDVVVAGATIYAVIVLPDAPVACTDDANPHAYVVALQRSKLPVGPFVIQLAATPVTSDEVTVVDADLSQPGTVATPDQISNSATLPDPNITQSGDIVETEFPSPYRMYVHCGIEWLGELNDVNWRTDQEMPSEWEPIGADQTIVVEVTIHGGNPPTAEVTRNGTTIEYQATTEPIPGCD